MMFGINETQLVKVCQEAVMEIFIPGVPLSVLDDKRTDECTPGLIKVDSPAIVFVRYYVDLGARTQRHVVVVDGDLVLDPYMPHVVSREKWISDMEVLHGGFMTESVIKWEE